MKLLSYHGTRQGIFGLGNILVRARLRGPYSHNEVMFEPGDGVDHLMPDGTCERDANGAYWCASAVGLERLPTYSPRRSGRMGGVRFKRIAPDANRWAVDRVHGDPMNAATWASSNQGRLYDWQFIFSFLAWFVPQKKSRVACCEACAEMLGFGEDSWRFDCCALPAALRHCTGQGTL